MKKKQISLLLLSVVFGSAFGQVTRLSNNTSYDWGFPISNTMILLRSSITKTVWAYDIPGNSFTQLSASALVDSDYDYGIMNGKLYFAAKTVAEGIELWVTDGTTGGTFLLKDINTAGAADSDPKYGFVVYNNELYFTANDGTTGRELWKTDGTGPGTVRVKDINPGAADAFGGAFTPQFKVFNGLLIFTASTAADGDEPWRTDGTDPGTTELKNIYTTAGIGSRISNFTEYGANLIFTAFDEVNGDAIWKTDGTPVGTTLVKDINPNPPFPPPLFIPTIIPAFFNFQNVLYFAADDGSSGYELWKTDGTEPGTLLVKDIDPGMDNGFPQMALAVKNSSKFFFSATTTADGTELWESDGTGSGTQLLKDISAGAASSDAIILPTFGTGLFMGDKFFIVANTPAEGTEFYVSDGTAPGTTLLKDINPGAGDSYDGAHFSIFYSNTKLYFIANNGTNGNEPWQSDGTGPGTTMVADVNTMPASAGSDIIFASMASNTLFFFGTDGDDAVNTDFFKLDAPLNPLPLRWISAEAKAINDDVLISWKTAFEEQTDYFIIQRSTDGVSYRDIGRLNTNNGASNSYSFKDASVLQQAAVKKLYYRIVCVDKDGKSSMSKVCTINIEPVTQFRILANPVNNELKLLIGATGNAKAVIRCMDTQGKLVFKEELEIQRGQNTVTSNISKLLNGVYFVQLIVNDFVMTNRIVIQR